jgi:hypothetical protein
MDRQPLASNQLTRYYIKPPPEQSKKSYKKSTTEYETVLNLSAKLYSEYAAVLFHTETRLLYR